MSHRKGKSGRVKVAAAAAELTKLLHALLVRLVQQEVTLFDGPVYLKTQAQTGVFHQLGVDVMDQSLAQHDRSIKKRNTN